MNLSLAIRHPMQNILYTITLIVLGSLLLAIAAHLSIPLFPVPITLQSVTVLFIGVIYGWRLGLSVVMVYLLEGLSGLPVFANATLFAPTCGYLFGFIPAVVITGFLMQHGWANKIYSAFLAACLGDLMIFICGYLVLANFVGMHNAYVFGVKPFLMIELIKLMVLALLTPKFFSRAH